MQPISGLHPRCTVCTQPLDRVLADLGATKHATCTPTRR